MPSIKSCGGIVKGTIEYLGYKTAITRNGTVFRNHGSGWKVSGHLLEGVTPEDAYQRRQDKILELYKTDPAFAAYRYAMLREFSSLLNRTIVHATIEVMYDDPDGVWILINDDLGVDMDFTDIKELCKLYQAYQLEKEAKKSEDKSQKASVDG